MKNPPCPECGKESVSSKMTGEECVVSVSDRRILGTQRNFDGVCRTHGPFWHGLIGHHGTLSVKELKKLFSKADRKNLLAKLPVAKRKIFKEALKGTRMPQREEIEYWPKIRNALRNVRSNSSRTVWDIKT